MGEIAEPSLRAPTHLEGYRGTTRWEEIRSTSDLSENSWGWVEGFRLVLFLCFYLLCVRMVFVTLTLTPPLVSRVVGATALSIAILTLWRPAWALYGFVAGVPLVSGLQVIGFLKGVPLLSVGFAGIYLAWLPRRLLRKEGMGSKTRIGDPVDVLSGVVLMSLAASLLGYPVDYVFYRFWCGPTPNVLEPLFSIHGAQVLLQGLFFFRVSEMELWRTPVPRLDRATFYLHAGLIAVFSFLQGMLHVPPPDASFTRLSSPFEDIHSYGSYVVFLFFLILIACLHRPLRWGAFYMGGATLFLILVILSWSRATWLALVITGLGLRPWRKRSLLAILCALVGVLVLVNLFPKLLSGSDNTYLQRLSTLVILEQYPKDSNILDRLAWYGRAVRMMGTYPLTGIGIGSYWRLSPGFELPTDKNPVEFQENAHNYYLQMGAELGVPGLLVFAWIICATYKAGLRAFKRKVEDPPFLKGLLFGLTAYLITMLTGHPLLLSNQQFLFWFIVVVIGSVSMPLEKDAALRKGAMGMGHCLG